MRKQVIDGPFRQWLLEIDEPIELVDENGRTVGFLLPVDEYRRLQRLAEKHDGLLYERAHSQFSEEELDRAAAEAEDFSTDEVLEYLRQCR